MPDHPHHRRQWQWQDAHDAAAGKFFARLKDGGVSVCLEGAAAVASGMIGGPLGVVAVNALFGAEWFKAAEICV